MELAYSSEELCEFFLVRVILEYTNLDFEKDYTTEISELLEKLREPMDISLWKNRKLGSSTPSPLKWKRWKMRINIRSI